MHLEKQTNPVTCILLIVFVKSFKCNILVPWNMSICFITRRFIPFICRYLRVILYVVYQLLYLFSEIKSKCENIYYCSCYCFLICISIREEIHSYFRNWNSRLPILLDTLGIQGYVEKSKSSLNWEDFLRCIFEWHKC